jgi:hypothetical protein
VKAFQGVNISARAAMIVLIATLVSGCAASGYDAGALKGRLVSAGLSRAEATCVVDHMGPRFGDTRLGVHGDPSAAELKAERALLKACGVKI